MREYDYFIIEARLLKYWELYGKYAKGGTKIQATSNEENGCMWLHLQLHLKISSLLDICAYSIVILLLHKIQRWKGPHIIRLVMQPKVQM